MRCQFNACVSDLCENNHKNKKDFVNIFGSDHLSTGITI